MHSVNNKGNLHSDFRPTSCVRMNMALYKIFKKMYTIASRLGYAPFLTRQKCSMVKTFYLFYLAVEIVNLCQPLLATFLGGPEIIVYMGYFYVIPDVMSTSYYIFMTVFHKNDWETFLTNLDMISRHGTVTENDIFRNKKAAKSLLIFITIVILQIVTLAAVIYVSSFYDSILPAVVGSVTRLMFLNLIFMLMMACVATLILAEEFEVLDNCLKSQVKKIMRNSISSETVIRDIFKQITDRHAEYTKVVRDLNGLFIIPIYLYLINIIMYSIHAVLINLFAISSGYDDIVKYIYVPSTIADVIIFTFFISSCDILENRGRQITKTCYVLQRGLAKSLLRDEIHRLATYTKKQSPAISAASLLTVNRRTVNIMFTVFCNLLITALQFGNYA
ncbi:hypothetical protein JTB14_008141 [Gonioctena quinquepunctata]|nr:hypothetical protein JTB14_008141 [Gonioctena quinquepunctata]